MADDPASDGEYESPEKSTEAQDEPTSPLPDHDFRDDEDDAFPTIDEFIGTFFQEPSLLPIVIAVLLSGGAFGAAMLILTVLDRNPFAAAALILITGMTVDICLQARKKQSFRNVARLIGLVWAVSVALAILALWSGIAFG
ncbi:MAG: hypothetical protein ACKVIW_11085 [bacterium]|jgi:hypothetical protein